VTHDGEERNSARVIGPRAESKTSTADDHFVSGEQESTPPPTLSPIQVLFIFQQLWPNCFSVHQKNRRPLKLKIHEEIIAALAGEVDAKAISAALGFYVCNLAYLSKIRAGKPRIGLDGMPAGTVTKYEEDHAKYQTWSIKEAILRREMTWTKPADHDDPDGKWARSRKPHPANADKPRLTLKVWSRS
jgi:sRNA-binding protein